MNKPTQNPKFTEEQMDQLLTTFYKMELPAELESPPSSWPALKQQSADQSQTSAAVSVSPIDTTAVQPGAPATGRGIVVAIATLAACLTIMAISNIDGGSTNVPGIADKVEPEDRDADGALIPVSGNGDADLDPVLDDTGVTAGEFEAISIESVTPKKEKPQDNGQ